MVRKEKYWIKHKKNRTLQEWSNMPVDWNNEAKLKTVNVYLWMYGNFIKGKENEFILKSTFGKKSKHAIIEELELWYNRCIGAYSEIEILSHTK